MFVGFRLAVGTKATVEEKEEKKACSSGGGTRKHTLSHIHTSLKPKGDFSAHTPTHSRLTSRGELVARYATVACLSMLRFCNAPLKSFVCVCVPINTDDILQTDSRPQKMKAMWSQSIDLLQGDRSCKTA